MQLLFIGHTSALLVIIGWKMPKKTAQNMLVGKKYEFNHILVKYPINYLSGRRVLRRMVI